MSKEDNKGLFSDEIKTEQQEKPRMTEEQRKAFNRKVMFLISIFAGFTLLSLFLRFLMDITGS